MQRGDKCDGCGGFLGSYTEMVTTVQTVPVTGWRVYTNHLIHAGQHCRSLVALNLKPSGGVYAHG